MKCAGEFVYVCAGPDGLWRKDVSVESSGWEALGFADSTSTSSILGAQDVDPIGDDILVACNPMDAYEVPGIWRSLDGGQSWSRSDSGVPSPKYPVSRMFGIARSPHDAARGIAVNGAAFTTADGGSTWSLVSETRSVVATPHFPVWNPHTAGEVWVYGEDVYWRPVLGRSKDWGTTGHGFDFVREPPVPHEGTVYDVAFDPFDPDVVLVGLPGMLARSEDGGENWAVPFLTDDRGRPFRAIVCSPHVAGLTYMAVGEKLCRYRVGRDSLEFIDTPFQTWIVSMAYHDETEALLIGTLSGVFQAQGLD